MIATHGNFANFEVLLQLFVFVPTFQLRAPVSTFVLLHELNLIHLVVPFAFPSLKQRRNLQLNNAASMASIVLNKIMENTRIKIKFFFIFYIFEFASIERTGRSCQYKTYQQRRLSPNKILLCRLEATSCQKDDVL